MKDLVDTIKDCASEVYKELGPGHRESVYHSAMAVEFNVRNIQYFVEHSVQIYYRDHIVGMHMLDFLVIDQKNSVIIELKATGTLTSQIKGQLKSYMNTLKVNKGILINFGYSCDSSEPDIFVDTNGSEEHD